MFSWKITFCFDKPISFSESGIAEHSRVLESGVKKVREMRVKVRRASGNVAGGSVARFMGFPPS